MSPTMAVWKMRLYRAWAVGPLLSTERILVSTLRSDMARATDS